MAENLISKDVVYSIVGNGAKESFVSSFVEAVNKYGVKYGIINSASLAAFVAQCAHESGGFQWYGESGYLKNQDAVNKTKSYYPYYGRGPLQVTHKDFYDAFSKSFFGDDRAVKNPNLLNDPKIGVIASLYWWGVYKPSVRGGKIPVAQEAQKGNINKVSVYVNGGKTGLAERAKYYAKAIAVFKKKIWNVVWKGATAAVNIPLHTFLNKLYLHYK